MDMRRKFMVDNLLKPLEVAYYPISQTTAQILLKPEYRYMDIVAIAAGGRATSVNHLSGCGSGGAFIVRKLMSTIGQIKYTYASGKLSISMSTNIIFEITNGAYSDGGVIPNASAIESTMNKFIDTANGGYFNFARSGGGGGGGGIDGGGTISELRRGGQGGDGGTFGSTGSKGEPIEGLNSGGQNAGYGSVSYPLSNKPFKIADIIKPGNPGKGGPPITYEVIQGSYMVFGGAGGGGAGLSYRNSGGAGGAPDSHTPFSGQDYGAGMSGVPQGLSNEYPSRKGGDPLFLIIYHNDNIPNDI